MPSQKANKDSYKERGGENEKKKKKRQRILTTFRAGKKEI
jgi:hypothetical protein